MSEVSEVASPCILQCGLNDKDLCKGCYRHIREIANWRRYNNLQKQAVVERCKGREAGENHPQYMIDKAS